MTDPLFDVSGKVTLVSGGSRGIGRAIAQGFAQRGAKVIITGRQQARLDETLEEFGQTDLQVESLVCDVSQADSVADCVDVVLTKHGQLDVLINVAGVNIRKSSLDFTEDEYDYVVNINQKGAFLMSQAAARAMAKQGQGNIINIDSLNTYAPLKNVLPYAMSKNAMVAMTRGLAMELGPQGIRVNSIAPGFILTDLTKKLWSNPTMQDWNLANSPAGRLGEPEDMVGAAIFLASKASEFMTGQVVRVDGGFSTGLHWPIPEDGGQ